MSNAALQYIIDDQMQKKHTHTVLLGVQSGDGRMDFLGAGGDLDPHSPYFIASITKMYTAALLMQLVDEGRLDLDTPITSYLPPDLIDGLHVIAGVDYGQQLTAAHLIHQTSGLADYFEGKPPGGSSVLSDLKRGIDREYSVADVMAMTRALKPRFAPGANRGRKAFYSDTNFQLQGAIIEAITDQPLADAYRARIFDPLGLAGSYLYDYRQPHEGPPPLPVYNRDRAISVPRALTSTRSDGGIVSTVPDSLRFLRAYFGGELFDAEHLPRLMRRWNAIFFPMQYGGGLMRFKLPRLMTLFQYTPELIGHAGATGSFAFYAPKEDLFAAGTLNQVDSPARPFFMLIKAIKAVE